MLPCNPPLYHSFFEKKTANPIKVCILSFLIFFFSVIQLHAQPKAKKINLTISYSISVTGKKIEGIAETYNGGIKTFFLQDNIVRYRLVSLMRTQSIFYKNKKGKAVAAVVKESGKQKSRFNLNAAEWKIFNLKYDSNTCAFFKEDTLTILNKLCQKAVITTKAGASLTVYYFPGMTNKTLTAAEPLFKCIPGLVLKYIYAANEKTIEYTAVSVSQKTIAASVFIIPVKGYLLQKYRPGTNTVNVTDLLNDSEVDMKEDDDEKEE